MKGFEIGAMGEMDNQIDKLVDGELNDGEMRELLLALESQPDGWRRCALAFVEAQTLRRDLAGIANARSEEQKPGQVVWAASRGSSRKSHLSTLGWTAVAASLLIAFTAGNSVRGIWTETVVAHTGTPETTVAMTDNNAMSFTDSESENNDADAPATSDESAKPKATVMVSLPAAEGEPAQSVEVPIVEPNADEFKTLLSKQEAVLSAAEMKTLEATGHEIEQKREFYPIKLDDGREVLVPMDIVRVRYTGGWQ